MFSLVRQSWSSLALGSAYPTVHLLPSVSSLHKLHLRVLKREFDIVLLMNLEFVVVILAASSEQVDVTVENSRRMVYQSIRRFLQGGVESVDTPALDRCLMTRPSHLRSHHQDHNMRPQPQLRTGVSPELVTNTVLKKVKLVIGNRVCYSFFLGKQSVAKGLLWRLKQNRRLAQLEG
ncbi:hypothetical protein DY000_02062834 [Brassica cretica]|uniref:Uncharacterized protein n=2 Tax=Brassica cretica TaxID=69181 RepID=A0ABQ7AX37_BRACR|nr:hypothetical protein DY000_02062834 [Brassica cretica]